LNQGEAKRTAEPTHNHRVGGVPFVTKKGSKVTISNCGSFPHAPQREEHKGCKTASFYFSYTLLISSTFSILCFQKIAAGLEDWLLSTKALNMQT